MKKFTKLLGIVLIIALVMSMGASAFAAQTYSISIDNALKDETYTAYKIFDVTYGGDNATPGDLPAAPAPDNRHEHTAYSYTITTASEWWNVIIGSATADSAGKYTAQGLEFAPTSPTGTYVVTATNSFDPAAFAVLLNNNKTNKTVAGTATGSDAGTATINVNPDVAGYYFVDTSLGSLCSLDTTEPAATIREKNTTTSQDKTVEEDSTGNFGDKDDADIGDTVNFKSTVTIGAHQKNVVFHDTMTTSLTFSGVDKVSVKAGDTELTTAKYPANTGNVIAVVAAGTAPETFTVTFDDAWTQSLSSETTVTITYSAVLNENAIIGIPSGTDAEKFGHGNDNKSKVTYGNAQETTEDWTRTYTWEVRIYKYAEANSTKTPLDGAKFYLYKDVTETTGETSTTTTYVAKWTNAQGGKFLGWEVSVKDNDGKETKGTQLVTTSTGLLVLTGLDADTYSLVETDAPVGYNKLKDPIAVVIDSNTDTAQGNDNGKQSNATVAITQNGDPISNVDTIATNDEVGVLNQSGTELPSTGGIGTTIFYVVGSIMVVAAGVLLITKKRMGRE